MGDTVENAIQFNSTHPMSLFIWVLLEEPSNLHTPPDDGRNPSIITALALLVCAITLSSAGRILKQLAAQERFCQLNTGREQGSHKKLFLANHVSHVCM
jgi:hypothetical protein